MLVMAERSPGGLCRLELKEALSTLWARGGAGQGRIFTTPLYKYKFIQKHILNFHSFTDMSCIEMFSVKIIAWGLLGRVIPVGEFFRYLGCKHTYSTAGQVRVCACSEAQSTVLDHGNNDYGTGYALTPQYVWSVFLLVSRNRPSGSFFCLGLPLLLITSRGHGITDLYHLGESEHTPCHLHNDEIIEQ